MKTKKIISSIAVSTIIFSVPLFVNAESIPDFPMSFWGNATVNSAAVPSGSIIRAYYGTILAGQIITSEVGVYGYTEPTRQKLVVGSGSGLITFTIQSYSINSGNETWGTVAQSYAGFTSGLTVPWGLNFTITSPAAPPASGGGGGGGGGSLPPDPLSTSTLASKGDSNGDGKINVWDFNSIMINWGRTGTAIASDFNGDGRVDIFDFNILMINWSK